MADRALADAGTDRASAVQPGPVEWRVIVTPRGELEELDGRTSIEFVSRHPILAGFARAFLATGENAVRFTWIDPERQWYSVCIESGPRGGAVLEIAPGEDSGLTPRELDVLTLVAGGLSNSDIAGRLGASPRTVTTHIEHILAKLDQSNRAGAASVAVDRGLVRLPVPGGGRSLGGLAVGQIDAIVSGRRPGRSATSPGRRRELRPLTVGAAIPVNDFVGNDGIEMRNGAQLAIDEINERGGVAGRRVELLAVDTDIMSAHGVRQAFAALVDAEVDAITSGYTGDQQVANEIVADYGCVYLNAATLESMIELVREDPSRYGRIFHVCPSDAYYGPGFIRFLGALRDSGSWKPPNRRLAVVQSRWPSMNIGLDSLVDVAGDAGWQVDVVGTADVHERSWGSLVGKVQTLEPAAVLLAHYWPDATVAFQRAFLGQPSDTLIYTLYGPSIPEFVEALGPAADGVLWATVTGVYSDEVGRRFSERYAAMHGAPPGRSHAGIAYDRVHILANAWARAGNARAFDRVASEVRQGVHRGVNGAYFFDHPGQCGLAYPDATPDPSIAQAHLVFQIQDGAHRVLYPAPYSDGSFRTPPWFRSQAPAS